MNSKNLDTSSELSNVIKSLYLVYQTKSAYHFISWIFSFCLMSSFNHGAMYTIMLPWNWQCCHTLTKQQDHESRLICTRSQATRCLRYQTSLKCNPTPDLDYCLYGETFCYLQNQQLVASSRDYDTCNKINITVLSRDTGSISW